MNRRAKDNELADLLSDLGVEGKHAEYMAHEIEAGDELLGHYGTAEVPAELQGKIKQMVRRRLAAQESWGKRLLRIGAVAAVVLAGLWVVRHTETSRTDVPIAEPGVVVQAHVASPTDDLFDDELDLAEMAFVQENYAELELDDATVVEMLMLLEETDWELDLLFGKEHSDEKVIANIDSGSGSYWV